MSHDDAGASAGASQAGASQAGASQAGASQVGASQTAHRMWTLTEPVHAVTYFAPEARTAFEAAGLRGFWRGYFAGRSAPLGPVAAAPVTASFFVFAPPMVSRAVPGVWDLITPAQALAVRERGAVAALSRLLAGLEESVATAADLLATVVAGLDCSGRVLAAANAALALPDEPAARLWQTATLLREHRGEGHFAALLSAGLDGCEANVLRAGLDIPRAMLQPIRGWADEQWDQAAARLAGRGLVDADGTATAAGAALLAGAERVTDAAASRPWRDREFAADLAGVLYPIAVACAAELPALNPIGVPAPAGDHA
ncbi:MAG: SCO6745 family protein [Streptosporangiaceae bacterium]